MVLHAAASQGHWSRSDLSRFQLCHSTNIALRKFSVAHRHLGPRNLKLIDGAEAEAGKGKLCVARGMAFSLDVEVVLLDIGRFVPLLHFGSLPFKAKGERRKGRERGHFSQNRSRVSQQG